jgi:transposase
MHRHEVLLFPERRDDYIAADNPVRFLAPFVDDLDLETLGFQRVKAAATGRPAYHPGALLQLYLSGSLYRLRSRRRLEQETHRNVALLGLLQKLSPDHKTLAKFRRDHLESLRQVCRAFPLLWKQLDLVSGELVAIDGSKCKAVNAQARHFTPSTLQRLLPQIDAQIEVYLKERERGDTEEEQGTCGGARAKHLQAKMAQLKERTLVYQAFQEPLLVRGQAQLSLTDPDSRAMKLGTGRGTAVCYNVHTAVDSQHTLILAGEVTNDTSDRDGLSPMALQAKAVLERPCEVVADRGDDHGDEVQAGVEAGITPYVARPLTSANKKLGLFSKEDLRYNGATDTYQCPAGALRTFRFDTVAQGRHIRYYATSAGKVCALKQACTRRKEGRRITRGVDEPLLEEMAERGRSRPEVMQRRKELVEHPFGTMKRWWDAGYFFLRGLEKVRTEFSLTVLAYNLRRVLNSVGMAGLMAALG